MIVVDAGVLYAAWFDAGGQGDRCAERVASETRVVAPELVTLEVLQTARRLVRSGRLDPALVDTGVDGLRQGVETVRHDLLAERVWALRENLTAYDAAYVALAELVDCPLITGDARLARAPGPRCDIELIAES